MSQRLLHHIPIQTLKGVGPTMLKRLHKYAIQSVGDLLLHLPFRYENRAIVTPIGQVLPGQHATIYGRITQTKLIRARRTMLLCTITDGSGIATLRFLNFNAGIKQQFSEGHYVRAYGEIKAGKLGPEIIHPQYQIDKTGENLAGDDETLTPIYPTTEGITQQQLRKLMQQALQLLQRNPPPELLPPQLLHGLPDIVSALSTLHFPPLDTALQQLEDGQHPAQKRLILEELLAYQLSMLSLRTEQRQHQAEPLQANSELITQFLAQLPFTPTPAQQRVIDEIAQDLQQPLPMMRLVQGDVGSGKTFVAAMAALFALGQGKQVALMAPTEILAEQHYLNFERWLTPLGFRVDWLAGRITGKAKQQKLAAIAAGEIQMVIGTHALFYEQAQFNNLALVIIDEQHRFGVNQRLSLWQKGVQANTIPHQLIMTATPIPRTLAMTIYADLDLSVIDELPPGRTPVKTVVIPNSRRDEIIARVQQVCQSGRQVYWVCTLVEESEMLDAQAAEQLCEDLQRCLPMLKVGLVHGKMKGDEKQQVMQAFKAGEIQLLVATTVIEVGVDVPNASLMIIENAERLGLSQLHQLRGRVGRGSAASHCVLLYQPPLSKTAQARLKVMRDSNDGFVIAQKDMEIRGIGEILGTKQIGSADFKVVDLLRDQAMIAEAQHAADFMQQLYPQQAAQLVACWLPDRQKYIHA